MDFTQRPDLLDYSELLWRLLGIRHEALTFERRFSAPVRHYPVCGSAPGQAGE